MLEIRKFVYHDKLREVLVTEETENSIRGIDMSYSTDKKEKEALHKLAEDVDFTDKKDEASMVELEKLKIGMKYFRHFKKSEMKSAKDSD